MHRDLLRRPVTVVSCCAGLILLSNSFPAYAQLGQSDLVAPGGPDAETEQIGNQPDFSQGMNPGRGWMPGSRFQKPGQNRQAAQNAMPSQGNYGGQDFPDNGGSMTWADTPKQTYQNYGQSASPARTPASSAFCQTNLGSQDAWSLPPAQEGAAWQAGIQSALDQAQGGNPPMQTMPAAPAQRQAQGTGGNLSGRVSNQTFPAAHFNPMNPTAGMDMSKPLPGMNAMGAGSGMNSMAGGMGGMNPMGGMGGMNPMGGMGALGALGGMMMGGGAGGGNPMDSIGKAIAGAAQMGLIPSTSKQGVPNRAGYVAPAGGGAYGGAASGGMPSGGGYSSVPAQGTITQRRTSVGQSINRMPGASTVRQVGRSVNRGITRNFDRAINQAARRGITRALWGY